MGDLDYPGQRRADVSVLGRTARLCRNRLPRPRTRAARATFWRLPATLAGIAALIIAGAAPAHADEVNFVRDLQARGVPMIGINAAQVMIGRGWTICAQIRNGESTQTAAREFGAYFWGQTLADVAQEDLCPDTLH